MRRLLLVALLASLLLGRFAAAQDRFPGTEWEPVPPAQSGWSEPLLADVQYWSKQIHSTAFMVVHRGAVVAEWGDTAKRTELASVRKSLLSALIGIAVAERKISLDSTLAQLGIDDNAPSLTEAEKQATVRMLLEARSGVYHAALYETPAMAKQRPARGSHEPGTFWYYNNWDFNALGTIYEQATHENIYDAFERDFAAPMQFQDFDRAQQRKTVNARASAHPAYHFYFSTRDMARVGYLMLRDGIWKGREIVPKAWVRRITTVVTPVAEMNPSSLRSGPFGYGYLWWIWDGPFNTGPYRGAYTGVGAVGQFLTVLPALDMVVAHKTRQGQASVSRPEYLSVLDAVIAAKCK